MIKPKILEFAAPYTASGDLIPRKLVLSAIFHDVFQAVNRLSPFCHAQKAKTDTCEDAVSALRCHDYLTD